MGYLSNLLSFALGASTASVVLIYLYIQHEDQKHAKGRKEEAGKAAPAGTLSRGGLLFGDDDGVSFTNRSTAAIASGQEYNSSFFTDLIAQLWPNILVVAEQSIRESLEPMLAEMSPKLTLIEADLGRTPLRLDNVVVHERTKGSDVVQFDMDVMWPANNIDIKLKAVFGSFGIKAIRLSGRLNVLLKPVTDDASLISCVQYAFCNTPLLELDFSGLAAVADLDVIDRQITQILRDSLEAAVVLPVRMSYKLVPECLQSITYQPPLGLVRLSAIRGRGFVVQKVALGKDDVPDVYLHMTVGTSKPIYTTPVIMDSVAPIWEPNTAVGDFLLCDYDQTITVHAWDEDKGRFNSDDDLGAATMTVGSLLLAGGTAELALKDTNVKSKDKPTGAFVTVHASVLPLTPSWDSFDAKPPSPSTTQLLYNGVLTVLISNASKVPLTKKAGTNAISLRVQCLPIEEEQKKGVRGSTNSTSTATGSPTKTLYQSAAVTDTPGYDAVNPVWDEVWHLPITSEMQKNSKFGVQLSLCNGEDVLSDTVTTITREALAKAPEHKLLDQRCTFGGNKKDGESYFCYSVILTGVQLPSTALPKTSDNKKAPKKDKTDGAGDDAVMVPMPSSSPLLPAPRPTAGRVRISAVSGRGFKVEKKRLRKNDVPDVYLKITVGAGSSAGGDVWRTSTIKDNIAPVWNESREFGLQDTGHFVQIRCYDENRRGKDDYYGQARVTVAKLLLGSGQPVELELMDDENIKSMGYFVSLQANMA